MSVTILEREMYTEAAAARLLRIAPSTLHWWLEGRPPRYRPVIRVEPTGSRNVTWAEFVEAGLLRSYRRDHDVPLKELRDFIDRLRDEFQVPYPLADRHPYIGPGRRLLIDLQGRSHLDPDFCLVAIANGQIVLTAPGEEFYERVDWSGDEPRPGVRTKTLSHRSGSTRWCVSGCPRSAVSRPKPSPANSAAEHPSKRSPTTSASTSTPCGGHKAMSCRSACLQKRGTRGTTRPPALPSLKRAPVRTRNR